MIPMVEPTSKPMTEMERILTSALKREQDLSETLSERILELEMENKTLKLKLQARYAAEVDDA